jgi:Spy/CpxP family protein refolding chaperone
MRNVKTAAMFAWALALSASPWAIMNSGFALTAETASKMARRNALFVGRISLTQMIWIQKKELMTKAMLMPLGPSEPKPVPMSV